jgi:hypothetical protein
MRNRLLIAARAAYWTGTKISLPKRPVCPLLLYGGWKTVGPPAKAEQASPLSQHWEKPESSSFHVACSSPVAADSLKANADRRLGEGASHAAQREAPAPVAASPPGRRALAM